MDSFDSTSSYVRTVRISEGPLQWVRRAGASYRIALFVLFVSALALFLHIREERVDILELHAKSTRYVIAQVPFSFADVEATQILRQQSVRDVGDIYRIKEEDLEKIVDGFSLFLRQDEEWRKKIPDATFEQMLKGAEGWNQTLRRERFTDSRTMQKMRQLKMPIRYVEVVNSQDKLHALSHSTHFWQEISDRGFRSELPTEARQYIVDWFRNSSFGFQQDIASERILRERVQEVVPQRYTRVEAGSPIIQPGERVTPRHLAMLNAMKEALTKKRGLWGWSTVSSSILLSILFTAVCALYIHVRAPQLLASLSKMTLLVTTGIVAMVFSKGTEYVLYHQASHLVALVRYPIFIPFASLVICVLVGTEIAVFATAVLTIVLSLSLASAFDYERFIVVNLLTGILAIVLSRRLRKRSQIFSVCAKLWLLSLPVIIAFGVAEKCVFSTHSLTDMGTTCVFLFAIAICVVGVLPVVEKCFGLLTDITLMQLLDPNHPLLRRLSLEAPGTYQHCLVAGHLAESAARAIGANGLFSRVSMLYHDIGKLFNPQYFTENQLGGFNIHQLLTPRESAQVIISHIAEGEALAKKYHLPVSFLDVIREHHGTTLVYFFYCKQLEMVNNEPGHQVDETWFRYPGPKPQTRESAIIMIVDSVEATVRSLDEVSEELLTTLVHRIVKEKVNDGQLDDCQLTFEELATVKTTIIKTLLIAHHTRVKYPTVSIPVPSDAPSAAMQLNQNNF